MKKKQMVENLLLYLSQKKDSYMNLILVWASESC